MPRKASERRNEPEAHVVDARAQIAEELSVGPSGGREDLVVMTEILRLVDHQIESTESVGGGQQQLQFFIGERLALGSSEVRVPRTER